MNMAIYENEGQEINRIRLKRTCLPLILEIEDGDRIYERPIIENPNSREPKVRFGLIDEAWAAVKRKIKNLRNGRSKR
jgi:hypothetical protein